MGAWGKTVSTIAEMPWPMFPYSNPWKNCRIFYLLSMKDVTYSILSPGSSKHRRYQDRMAPRKNKKNLETNPPKLFLSDEAHRVPTPPPLPLREGRQVEII